MFLPGFFTGGLVRRFGVLRIMVAGCALMLGTLAVAHHGVTYWHFWGALALLGVGWNFMFVGATTLLTRTYTAREKAKVQGVNDLAVWTTMITSSASSGVLVSSTGWTDLNLYALPFVLLAMLSVVWLMARRSAMAAAA
jgi:MFS family permease